MYIVKTPSIIKPFAKDFLWQVPTTEKEIYLTFDDGPTPGVTDIALDLLKASNAKATFFCLGKNVEAHSELFSRIKKEGHSIGNHSWDHPDGWKTHDVSYLKNVLRASKVIDSKLFRPPYGRITPKQIGALKHRFKAVMWTVLSADFDTTITPEKCLENVLNNIDNGSIVVFHDSIKAKTNMLYALEHSLQFFNEEGYTLRALPL
jgi:peptidoglycan/xylan/chitin deacetylase (PgdA/CDA1 family)